MQPSSTRPGLASVRPQTAARTRNWIDAGYLATELFARAAATVSNTWLQHRSGKDESNWRRWRLGERDVPFKAILALPRDAAARVLRDALAEVEADAPAVSVESSQRRITAAVGALALELERALADGRLDEGERDHLSVKLTEISLLASRGAVDVRRVG